MTSTIGHGKARNMGITLPYNGNLISPLLPSSMALTTLDATNAGSNSGAKMVEGVALKHSGRQLARTH